MRFTSGKDIKKIFISNCLTDRGVCDLGKKRGKKSAENIWKGRKKVLIFAPALRERRRLQPRDFDRSDEVLRRFDKIFRKDLEDSEKVVTFAARKEVSDGRDASERVLEVFELKRNLEKKIWRFQKKCLSLHHFPLKKRRSVKGRGGVIGAPEK
ncbi:hypothetical protein B5E60_13430 [Alistipes sp. An116]|nr:hypothetical protein B5E60_13430 [Alistipes sp. An116]